PMELRTLRYFVHVADARSFSKASVFLRVAQPALSRQIRKLEDEIGMPLFVRAGHHLEMTEAGSLLLNRAHLLLRQVSNTLDEVRASASNLGGTLTIGVSPATSELVAPLLMRECAQLYPQLRLDFIEGFSRYVFEQLLNQGLALCLIHNPPPHKSIAVHPLLSEAMYLVGPPRRVGALAPVTAKSKVDGLPLILPNETHALRQLIGRALGGARLKIAAQTDGMVTTRALVCAGQGYTILPYSAIHQPLINGQLSAARLADIDIPWTLALACWNDQRAARAVLAVRDILTAHFQELVGDAKWGTVPAPSGVKRASKSKARALVSPRP
ncbi:MAG TPA: LysR family transcriptional regulator, partial [Ktedonobacterales bacterium]|nr:LysR family transcriptional regulator [Ktedonobacterales bacterium]